MSLLKPVTETSVNAIPTANLPPPKICEACGKTVAVGHDAINIIQTIGSPGHPMLAPFQCPHMEHWACSVDCWQKVAHACIDEHLYPVLIQKHMELKERT